jgi:ABC-type glycerol-3-phosphate transport system substrate-binding protein
MRPVFVAAALTLALLVGGAGAEGRTRVEFWHYLVTDAANTMLDTLASDFNKSQSKYQVLPKNVGSYQELSIKVIAALRGGGLPAMAMTDNAFFTKVAFSGELLDFTPWVKELPAATINDFQPVIWEYGDITPKESQQVRGRFGLPWTPSLQILYYNQDKFKTLGLEAPKSWDQFANTARKLTGRGVKGGLIFAEGWQFGSIVASQGGAIFNNGEPSFNDPKTIASLDFLQGLTQSGALQIRSPNEMGVAIADFLRTKAFMVVAPSSGGALVQEYSVAFKLGAVALPGKTIAGESQLVVFKKSDPAAQRGAFEFWHYLMQPENQVRWCKASFYLPVRKSAVKDLAGFAASNPAFAAALDGLAGAINFVPHPNFNEWRLNLEEALDKSLRGNTASKIALEQAQKKSEK